MPLEKILAAIGLAIVLVVWLGTLLSPARRQRLGDGLRRGWRSLRTRGAARREAADAIERARRRPAATREGNVIRPRSFQRQRDDDPTLH
ncbi:MAG: hypothetical protein JNM33_09720 [Rubrivivax sp.]|nr:hypothetical protein [Rubrivivax sp.]